MSESEFESISSLMIAARQGDSPARDQLFEQIQSYLNLMAEVHTRNQPNQKYGASDIVQQTCINAVDKFEDFNGKNIAQFKAWLKQILLNSIRQNERALKRIKRDVAKEIPMDHQPARWNQGFVDGLLTPATDAIQQEQLSAMYAKLDELPDDYQQVIRLRSLEGLSFQDVADRMNRSLDSVTKLWYRAFARLCAELERTDESQS